MHDPKTDKKEPEIIENLSFGEVMPETPFGDVAYIKEVQNQLNKEWRQP